MPLRRLACWLLASLLGVSNAGFFSQLVHAQQGSAGVMSDATSPSSTCQAILLADYLDIPTSAVVLLESELVWWGDTSLGCPQPGVFYAQIMVPGSRHVFQANNRSYDVRTGWTRVILCEDLPLSGGKAVIELGSCPRSRTLRMEGDLVFGVVLIGSNRHRTLILHNDGEETVTVSQVIYPAGFNGDWNSGEIPAKEFRIVTITFSPIEAKIYSGEVEIVSNATSGHNRRNVWGAGAAAGLEATHTSSGYNPGGIMTVTARIVFSENLSSLGWEVDVPGGWSYNAGQNDGQVKPVAGQTGRLEWAWTTVPQSPIEFSYSLNVPTGESGAKQLSARAQYFTSAGNSLITTAAAPDPLVVSSATATEFKATQWTETLFYPIGGGRVRIENEFYYAGTLQALGWEARIPEGWSYENGENEPAVKPVTGETDTLEWAWPNIPDSPVQFSYTLNVPPTKAGEKKIEALAIYFSDGSQEQRVTAAPLVLHAPRFEAVRFLSSNLLRGGTHTALIRVKPPKNVTSWLVVETPPEGWHVSNITDGGAFDSVNQRIKWGSFVDANSRSLAYELTPPVEAEGKHVFAGIASFDGVDIPIAGVRQATPVAAVDNAHLGHPIRLAEGEMGFGVAVRSGRQHVVQASSDLLTWMDVVTVTAANGSLIFIDPEAINYDGRFYRVLELGGNE